MAPFVVGGTYYYQPWCSGVVVWWYGGVHGMEAFSVPTTYQWWWSGVVVEWCGGVHNYFSVARQPLLDFLTVCMHVHGGCRKTALYAQCMHVST